MILVPEIKTVVILVPRTGSGSLYRAIAAAYPASMLLYRHMEADGVPQGYDRWRKVGVVRHPVDRLWSLYRFLKTFGGPGYDETYVAEMRASVDRPFEDWLLNNHVAFSTPYRATASGELGIHPQYTQRYPIPDTRKSQFINLRPDLGTEVFRYDALEELEAALGVALARHNATEPQPTPALSPAAAAHIRRFFAWDLQATGGAIELAAPVAA